MHTKKQSTTGQVNSLQLDEPSVDPCGVSCFVTPRHMSDEEALAALEARCSNAARALQMSKQIGCAVRCGLGPKL